jgi:uncharacterized membrane protein YqaE (UPF0057 family)
MRSALLRRSMMLHPIDGKKGAKIMSKLLLVIIAIVLPPLAVGLKAGIGFHLFLNIVLTLLLYLPGMLHALWIVLKD